MHVAMRAIEVRGDDARVLWSCFAMLLSKVLATFHCWRAVGMRFNFWFVIFLALMPVFILFTGLSAAGGFTSSVAWPVIGVVIAAAITVGYLAGRGGDELLEDTPSEAIPRNDPSASSAKSALDSDAGYSSSLPELEQSYSRYSNREEVLALLSRLLEAERAVARGVRRMSEQATGAQTRTALREIAKDEAQFCAKLSRHIARFDETPSGVIVGCSSVTERLPIGSKRSAVGIGCSINYSLLAARSRELATCLQEPDHATLPRAHTIKEKQ